MFLFEAKSNRTFNRLPLHDSKSSGSWFFSKCNSFWPDLIFYRSFVCLFIFLFLNCLFERILRNEFNVEYRRKNEIFQYNKDKLVLQGFKFSPTRIGKGFSWNLRDLNRQRILHRNWIFFCMAESLAILIAQVTKKALKFPVYSSWTMYNAIFRFIFSISPYEFIWFG